LADPTLDKDFMTYAWFDALTNYISFVGYTVGEAEASPTTQAQLALVGRP
jgi:hypothetical protein